MFLSGLWHGAGWTYVIWGGLHGFYLVVAHQWQRFIKWRAWRLDYWWYRFSSVALTFILVLFAWVFFPLSNLGVAGHVLYSMVGQHGLTMPYPRNRPGEVSRPMVREIGSSIRPLDI